MAWSLGNGKDENGELILRKLPFLTFSGPDAVTIVGGPNEGFCFSGRLRTRF
jgi:hypothetical protein